MLNITILDRVKIQLQIQYPRTADDRVFKTKYWHVLKFEKSLTDANKYSGPIDVTRKIVKSAGMFVVI